MGLLDMELMFDLLDTDMRGYLTSNQLQDFHESLYFSPIDPRQIEAAIRTICGNASRGLCPREKFMDVLDELDRRKGLEEKISWDFKALDVEGKGRISLKTALLLFKAVHNELFSMKTWRSFVSHREYPDEDVCFDEIKMFLCNLVDGGPCEKEEFDEEERDVGFRSVENKYRNLKELEKFQEDEASLAAEEREKMHQANKLKQGAERRTKRLDHEGVVALLHEDEEWDEKGAKKARHKVTATDLIQALRTKYEILRDKLLLEMLRHHIGEGMWTVLSEDEQYERLMQVKMRVQRLRKDSKLDGANSLPGAGLTFFSNLLALMGLSRMGDEIQQREEAEKIKEMEKEGKSNKEIEEELLKSREKALQGHAKSEQLLLDLEKRYQQDKDAITAKLKGAGTNTMTAEQKLTEYGLIIREQLRAREEGKFESASLAVGIAERLKEQVQRPKDDRKRQEQLGKERVQQRKGRKLPRNWKGGELEFSTPGEAGLVDVLEDTVRALERKHAMERELLIYLLQGRESVQARSAAKKLSPDERSNQLLVLRTQQQGWRKQSTTERLVSKERHYVILQEAAGLVIEDRRADLRVYRGTSPDDQEVAADIMADLQHHQEAESQMLLTLHGKDMQELFRLRQLEHQAWQEELLDGITSVLLGIEENVAQEDELLQALEEKYDALRDKLLLDALEKQMGAAEWAHLSEQERQARLAKLKLQERRLRQQGRFDDAAALLGEGLKNAETLQALLGENRQRYLERLKERLERRQKRLEEGLDPDEEDEETLRLLNEEEAASTGNILKDLQNRFDEEKDALLRRLQEEHDRLAAEKRRQAELARLRREKRQAERESRFDEAALVLGLAERNRKNLEERLRRDRERQEQLARERLARRKRRGKPEEQEEDDEPDPDKDDLQGWQDAVLKSLERKHRAEQEFLMGLLQDESSESMREEARTVNEDDRLKRLSELKGKREELDLGVKADRLLHVDILDMAAAYKFEVQRYRLSGKNEGEVNDEETQAELSALKDEHEQERKDEVVENVATVLLEYDGTGSDKDLISALDQKYDTLKDKLLLEALKKQLGDAEWAQLSEQERQKRLVKLKLEERRLRKEGQLDELHRLLGEGFEMDANLRKLMGENRARYEEKLKERLARRRERLAQGLTPDDEDEEDLEDGQAEGEQVTDVKAILEDLDKRYEEEKEALMRSLQGQDERFMSERQRQAELARLKREKLKAKQEDKFTTAALVLGLAEKQKAAVEERLRQDRLRQEQLARERLEQLRNRKRAKEQEAEEKLVTDGEISVLQEAVMKALERKHQDERQALLDVLQQEMPELAEAAATMTQQQRENWLQQISMKMNALDPADKEARHNLLVEAAVFKVVNRQKYLELSQEETVKKDDVIVSLLADLQQEQDQESEKLVNEMQDKDKTELVQLQENLLQARKDASQQNVIAVVTEAEIWGTANERDLSQALNYKYDALKDRLLRDALVQQVGVNEWQALSENDRLSRLAQMKLKVQALKSEGKQDEIKQLLGEAAAINLISLMGEDSTQHKQRQIERQQKREQRKPQGMSDEEILKLEVEEDAKADEEALKKSTGNTVQDLENRLNNETESLLADVRGADAKFESEQHRHAQLARIRYEERQALQESSFQPSALVLGLVQARQINMDNSILASRDTNREEAVLKEMERKHLCELLVLESLISEEKESDLRKTSQQLSKEQQQERLFELKELRKQWRESGPEEMTETVDEQEAILREGVGLKLELSREELRQKAAEEGKELGPDDDAVSLLAALQQHQEQEAEYLLRDLAVKNPMVLQQLQSVHSMACKERWYDNLATCVLGLKRKQARLTAEESAEEELVEALEQKYDALKDKLLTEALMKQMGDAEWAALSERERQAKLLKLKLQERKLRQEGKLDEASRLLGEGMKHDAALRALMGESKSLQKQRLQERLDRLRQLKQQGSEVNQEEMAALEQVEAEGVDAVDTEVLNDLIKETVTDAEEVTTNTLLHDLSSQFEEEKEALLRALRQQDVRFDSERKRQLELAKLRREQRRLKQEDNFDTAAILLGLAKQERAAREANFEKDRARQEQLARERIAAIKARRAAKKGKSGEEVQKELVEKLLKEQAEDIEIDKRNALDVEQGGLAQLQETILSEVERKHSSEQEALTDLLAKAEADQDGLAAARYLNETERQTRVVEIGNERKAWRMDAVRDAMQANPDELQTEEEKKANATRIAASRLKHMKLLKDALVLHIENKRAQLLTQGVDEEKLQEKISVLIMADLQEKQKIENNAVANILGADKDESVLVRIRTDQRMARREGWMDNVAATLMGSRPMRKRSTTMAAPSTVMANLVEADEEEVRLEEEQEAKLAEMEAEMEKEKEARKLAGATEEEIQRAMELLQKQHEAKRKAMAANIERQRNMVQQRLEAKRRKREEQQYEEDMAASIVTMAEKQFALIREKTMMRREGQKETLNERLARRRAEREKKKAEEEEARRKEEEEANRKKAEEEAKKAEEPKQAPADYPLPGGFAMKREKTVIDVEVSKEKQQEILSSLLREHTNVGMKFERERTRQEEMLKARKERKKSRIERKQEEVATIMGLGERQKTFVEQQKKEERERQITMVRERIARVRYERTMTMREPKDEKAQGFESLLTEEEKEGLSEEERMKRIAAKMEEKFKSEQRRVSTVSALAPPSQSFSAGGSSAETSEEEGPHTERSSQLLDEKSRNKKLKERMASRKRERRRSVVPPSGEEGGATGGADE
ncbi:hypothetical protein AWC38_SpisGene19720 [Stylophora pistillata]|uniref:EF-hand domain-containing protein n=1 Tax=Stylophora pistillata TaxID=50429 RepID=A0A2B4RI19_STYPI|nr:hypothetical protein AWC38_SpisGene19720 [Stylophora pistillata]